MLHFRSHETPTLIHPASRTRDMHTPLEDNLRCMGKKFPRNFLESKNLYRAEVFHIIGLLLHTNHRRDQNKRSKNSSHFPNRNNRRNDISHPKTIHRISLFFLSLSFFLSPHSQLRSIESLRYSNIACVFRYHTVTNAFIFQSTMYQDRPDTGRRHLITDHYPGEFERGVSRDILCDAQGEGRMENKEKKKTGRRKK